MADMQSPSLPVRCILVLLGTALLFFSCSPATNTAGDSKKPIRIGFSMDSYVVERWQRDRDVFTSCAQDLGAQVVLQNANENSETQIKQIDYLINLGVDALVVVPNDRVKLADAVNRALGRGIPVLCYDRLVEGAQVNAYICFDNVRIGELMAQGAVKAAKSGELMIINGSTADSNSYLFNQGFHKVLDPLVEKGSYSIIQESWLSTWATEESVAELQKVLDRGQLPRVVIAANDFLAESVITTLTERRLLDKVAVIGHDAELSACQRIVEGTQYMTVYKPIDTMAAKAAEAAFALAQGKSPGWNTLTSVRGFDIPTIMLEPVAVDKKNMMATIIAWGFHRYDDVYRNIPQRLRPKL